MLRYAVYCNTWEAKFNIKNREREKKTKVQLFYIIIIFVSDSGDRSVLWSVQWPSEGRASTEKTERF